MPKNSKEQIKQDEIKILNQLLKNANKSINDIAKSLGFSRQKVWRIVKNLEDKHTIWGYATILDNQKLGKKRFILLLKRSNKPVTKDFINQIINRDMAKKVKKMGINFVNSVLLNGHYDWLISFTADNLKDAKNLIELYYKTYEGLISEIHLVEHMFPVLYDGIQNPEIEKLKDYFTI